MLLFLLQCLQAHADNSSDLACKGRIFNMINMAPGVFDGQSLVRLHQGPAVTGAPPPPPPGGPMPPKQLGVTMQVNQTADFA